MIRAFCIWYLRMTNTAVFLNFEIVHDVHVATDAKRIYQTQLTKRDKGSFIVHEKR